MVIQVKALLCEIRWMRRYHGEEDFLSNDQGMNENKENTNFINFNGTYYGYFPIKQLPIKEHHRTIDFVIFFAKNPKGSKKVVGWYRNATIFRDEQLFNKDSPYFIKARDTDVFLLEERKRVLSLNINSKFKIVELDKRNIGFLSKTTNRINYHSNDELVASNYELDDLDSTNKLIESAINNQDCLRALHIIQTAIQKFGQLATLLYYQAYVLYLFQQYDRAAIILSELAKTNTMREHAIFLLGVIFFDSEAYDESITMLKRLKELNIDQAANIISQAYAMLKHKKLALEWIDKAIAFMPLEDSYQEFKQQLVNWG